MDHTNAAFEDTNKKWPYLSRWGKHSDPRMSVTLKKLNNLVDDNGLQLPIFLSILYIRMFYTIEIGNIYCLWACSLLDTMPAQVLGTAPATEPHPGLSKLWSFCCSHHSAVFENIWTPRIAKWSTKDLLQLLPFRSRLSDMRSSPLESSLI